MNMDVTRLYGDIIDLRRPASTRPRMPRADRAKIFSPFAAVKGYDEAVKNTERPRVNKLQRLELEEEKERLNFVLCRLERGQTVTVTFFRRDPGPDGAGGMAEGVYETVQGKVVKVDAAFQMLRLDTQNISFDDIWKIKED